MRRTTALSMIVATTLLMAAPAASAQKPDTRDPQSYTVDIAFAGERGVATTCVVLDEDGNEISWDLVRTDERRGTTHFESYAGASLAISADLERVLPGCHGEPVAPEYLRITLDREGTVAILWIFDVETTEEIVTLKNGKTKTETVRTDFRMGGPYTPAGEFAATTVTEAPDGTLSFVAAGSFSFVHYASDGDPMMVELDGSPDQFELAITLTPN